MDDPTSPELGSVITALRAERDLAQCLLWEAFLVLRKQSPMTGEVSDIIWKIQVEGPWDNQAKRSVEAGHIDVNGHPILSAPNRRRPLVHLGEAARSVLDSGRGK